MRTIEIRVPQAEFADILNAMREWLDREKCFLSRFSHASGKDGIVVISAGFPNADDPRLDAFHQQFGQSG
jgi:hypothetical protein